MIKVAQYIETIGTADYKKFVNQPFSNEETMALFDGWRGKFMNHWYRYTNDDNIELEFYPEHYIIKTNEKADNVHKLLLPKTINDFINDISRLGVALYWKPFINLEFEPKDYLPVADIPQYYVNLLTSMGKLHELNI